MPYDVFLSYSRQDEHFLDSMIQVLELGGRTVFVDRSIRPGQLWEDELKKELAESKQMVLLWCCHSSTSEWVHKEIAQAISETKPLVPMLMCGAAIPDSVARFQWIDMRQIFRHSCEHSSITADVVTIDAATVRKMSLPLTSPRALPSRQPGKQKRRRKHGRKMNRKTNPKKNAKSRTTDPLANSKLFTTFPQVKLSFSYTAFIIVACVVSCVGVFVFTFLNGIQKSITLSRIFTELSIVCGWVTVILAAISFVAMFVAKKSHMGRIHEMKVQMESREAVRPDRDTMSDEELAKLFQLIQGKNELKSTVEAALDCVKANPRHFYPPATSSE